MPQTSLPHAAYANAFNRQPFHRPHTSLGATGHWVKTAGILAPLVIGELVKDADKRWRWIRLSSVATALVSEAMWTNKIRKERSECEQSLER
jgi:hypothetical protein